MSKDNTELKILNNHLRYGENRNRSGVTKVEQCVKLHEALHHRPHQQEY